MFDRLVDSPTRRRDPLLNSYSNYEDSVYGNRYCYGFCKSWFLSKPLILKPICSPEITGLAWSSREPWIFASLSYDGRVSTSITVLSEMNGFYLCVFLSLERLKYKFYQPSKIQFSTMEVTYVARTIVNFFYLSSFSFPLRNPALYTTLFPLCSCSFHLRLFEVFDFFPFSAKQVVVESVKPFLSGK